MVQKLGITKKVIKVGKISGKSDILTVEDKRIALIINKTKISLGMTPIQIQIEAGRLKAAKIRFKNKTEKDKDYFQIMVGKIC